MNVEAARVPVRAAGFRVAVAPEILALLGLGLLTALLAFVGWNTWGALDNDTGYDVLAGVRVAHGDIPYIDYVYYYGPLAPFAVGLFAWIGGAGLGPAIALGLVLAGSIVLATYALARTQVGVAGSFLAAAIVVPVAFSPTYFSYVDPHTYSAPLALLTLLGFLLGVARYARDGGRSWLLGAGICGGVVALTRPEFEAALLVAAAVWLFLRKRAGLAARREALVLALPALAIPAAVYSAFLTAISAHRLLFGNLYPTEFLQMAGNTMLRARTPMTATSVVQLGGKLVIYAVGVCAILLAGRAVDRSPEFRRAAPALGGLVAVLAAAAAVADPEALRHGLKLAYGWIPGGAAVGTFYLLRGFARRKGPWTPSAQAELVLVVALTVVAASTYAAFYPYAFRPQMAVYAMPLVAVFLARLHLVYLGRRGGYALGLAWLAFLAAAGVGLTLKDAGADSATIRGPGGAVAATPAEAAVYRPAVTWISDHTRPGEPILLAPQLTWLYTLSGRVDPLPELSLLPGVLGSPQDERRAIAQLDAARVRLVIVDRKTYSGYGHSSFGGSFDRVLAGWIRNHFERVATLRGHSPGAPNLDIWHRRAP